MLSLKSVKGMGRKAWKRGYWDLSYLLNSIAYALTYSSRRFANIEEAFRFCKQNFPASFGFAYREVTKYGYPCSKTIEKAIYKADK